MAARRRTRVGDGRCEQGRGEHDLRTRRLRYVDGDHANGVWEAVSHQLLPGGRLWIRSAVRDFRLAGNAAEREFAANNGASIYGGANRVSATLAQLFP